MTLANRITLTRAVLAVAMFGCIMLPGMAFRLAALFLLLLAGLTDWIDGIIARRTASVTPFGAIADPFVDKILVLAAFVAFAATKELNVPPWAVFLILVRELMISSLRVLAALGGDVLAAEKWGKWKTVVQITATFIILGILNVKTWVKARPVPADGFASAIDKTSDGVTYALAVFTAVVTLASGIGYLYNHRVLLKNSWNAQKKQ